MNEVKYPKVAAAVVRSWQDPLVHAARCARWGCQVSREGVDVGEYESVPAAFRALKLQFNRHIKLRGKMVKQGEAVFFQDGNAYTFKPFRRG